MVSQPAARRWLSKHRASVPSWFSSSSLPFLGKKAKLLDKKRRVAMTSYPWRIHELSMIVHGGFLKWDIDGWWFWATPLKNDGVRQLGWLDIPNISGKIENGNQTTNQDSFFDQLQIKRIQGSVCHFFMDPHLPSTKTPVLLASIYRTYGCVMGVMKYVYITNN